MPITAQDLLEKHLQKHFPLSAQEMISQASLEILQHEESLRSAILNAKSASKIVDEDGFTTVVYGKRSKKRSQSNSNLQDEKVFSPEERVFQDHHSAIQASSSSNLYRKSKFVKKQAMNQQVESLRSKFKQDVASLFPDASCSSFAACEKPTS